MVRGEERGKDEEKGAASQRKKKSRDTHQALAYAAEVALVAVVNVLSDLVVVKLALLAVVGSQHLSARLVATPLGDGLRNEK